MLLLGRKGQDGDLGAAPAPLVLSTLWQRRGTAGAPGLLLAFACSQGLGLLPLEREVGLSENLQQMTLTSSGSGGRPG